MDYNTSQKSSWDLLTEIFAAKNLSLRKKAKVPGVEVSHLHIIKG